MNDPAFIETLKRHDLRVTRPRKRVFETLRTSHQPLQIGEIIKRTEAVDRVSVYRTLETFTEIGVATIITTGWKRAYELKSPFAPHHHHLQCTRCQALIDIKTPEIETMIETIAARHGFVLSSHHIELQGTCHFCATKVK